MRVIPMRLEPFCVDCPQSDGHIALEITIMNIRQVYQDAQKVLEQGRAKLHTLRLKAYDAVATLSQTTATKGNETTITP